MAIDDSGRHRDLAHRARRPGIVTDTERTASAKIARDPARAASHEALDAGSDRARRRLPGRLDATFDVTTLGRGGSDTTAVALAAALGADACEIYTDVEGVFTADPRRRARGAQARRASRYEEMLELAASGAKVLHAALGRVRTQSRRAASTSGRSFSRRRREPGSSVEEERDGAARSSRVSRTTPREAEVTILGVPDRPGIAARVFRTLADVEHERGHDRPERVGRGAHGHLVHAAEDGAARGRGGARAARGRDRRARASRTTPEIAKVSLVGAGMRTHPGVAADMFDALAAAGINIGIVDLVGPDLMRRPGRDVERAVQAVHECFQLHEPVVSAEA